MAKYVVKSGGVFYGSDKKTHFTGYVIDSEVDDITGQEDRLELIEEKPAPKPNKNKQMTSKKYKTTQEDTKES